MIVRTRGLSLVSFLVAASIFAFIFAFGLRSFHQSSQVWRKMNSVTEASVHLRRASNQIQGDLLSTSYSRISTLPGPTSLTGYDGDAIWFLSALDANGNFMRKGDGSPFWQRHILYYTVTPNNQEVAPFGIGGSDPQGYEDYCPYKVLIRKEIDVGTLTDLADETTEEQLMTAAQISAYLTRPTDYKLQNLASETGVTDIRLVARGILTTRVSLDSGAVSLRVLVSSNDQARKYAGYGSMSLTGQPFIHEVDFTVVPRIDGE